MDNVIFNVNGKDLDLLTDTLKLLFKQRRIQTVKGWQFSENHGLILLWTNGPWPNKPNAIQLLAPSTAEEVAPQVFAWLKSEQAKSMPEPTGWDADCDHDGHNSLGWRVYVEDWGHVNGNYEAACAIRPAYMWHGK